MEVTHMWRDFTYKQDGSMTINWVLMFAVVVGMAVIAARLTEPRTEQELPAMTP